ncbi:MAG: hypothetical protein KJ613_02385 [Nanoarchaeota archaeon]|nr:hypothetical protein [Nanoarchaeota archaeon]MBU1135467.1 hypothetical protein [Nanoarchaeota archaeon]
MKTKLIVLLLVSTFVVSIIAGPVVLAGKGGSKGPSQCKDGIDNDNDGFIDYPNDLGCDNKNDNDEWNPTIIYCGDGTCNGDETCETCSIDCGECPIPNSCSDTDGGITTYTIGTVSGYYNEEPYEYTDFCSDEMTLREYYCVNGQWNSMYYTCQGYNESGVTCMDGACI